MARDKTKIAIMKSKTIATLQMIIGCILAFIFGVTGTCMLVDKTSPVAAFVFCLVVFSVGVLLIVSSVKRTRLIRCFREYVAILNSDPTFSLETLAHATRTSLDLVRKNVQRMIQKGFFADAAIDDARGRLILGERHAKGTAQVIPSEQNLTMSAAAYTLVQCNGCGATSKIAEGTVGECEFCGSKVQAS